MPYVSKTFLTAAAATMLIAGSAAAQTTAPNPNSLPSTGMSPPASSSPAGAPPASAGKAVTMPSSAADSGMGSAVMGLSVKGTDNTKIGKIDDVLISPDGKVDKVVIDVGGVLGVGGKDVMVDWKDLQINSAERVAQVDMSKDQLKKAPAYHPSRQANAADTSK